MNRDEKLTQMSIMLDEDYDTVILSAYLLQAKSLILNKRFPFGYESDQEVEPKYEQLQIELAIALFNERGAEGQANHNENGISRSWRTKSQLLEEVVPYASAL